jgi:hypothetical protein
MLHLYSALAEKERRLIAERTKAAMAAKKAAGANLGNPKQSGPCRLARKSSAGPRGHEFASSLVPVVNAIRASGARTLASMAIELNRRGVRSAQGGEWHASSVANLIGRTNSLA